MRREDNKSKQLKTNLVTGPTERVGDTYWNKLNFPRQHFDCHVHVHSQYSVLRATLHKQMPVHWASYTPDDIIRKRERNTLILSSHSCNISSHFIWCYVTVTSQTLNVAGTSRCWGDLLRSMFPAWPRGEPSSKQNNVLFALIKSNCLYQFKPERLFVK